MGHLSIGMTSETKLQGFHHARRWGAWCWDLGLTRGFTASTQGSSALERDSSINWLQISRLADEMKVYMIQNNAAIGVTFSGKLGRCWRKIPTSVCRSDWGQPVWFDNMVIPKTVKNQDTAMYLINFMLKPENALKNTEYTGCANHQPRKCSQRRRLIEGQILHQTLIPWNTWKFMRNLTINGQENTATSSYSLKCIGSRR